jgi:hypothetical protein
MLFSENKKAYAQFAKLTNQVVVAHCTWTMIIKQAESEDSFATGVTSV